MNFNDFVKSHPTCSVVAGNKTAQYIYDKIVWNDTNRIKMAEFSDSGICALAAIVDDVEKCASASGSTLDLSDDTVKKVVGRMIAEALEPLGYLPVKKRRIPKKYLLSYFSNASVYSKDGAATEKIVKHIEKI